MKMIYNVKDKPKFGQLIVFAFQQLLAIMAATIAVPMIVGNGMSTSAALFGAGVGTLIYVLFTKRKSPVFLGSSFAFLGAMFAAFGGAASAALGYMGIIIGAILAGLVYVVIAIIVKFAGVKWINKIMPAVVIGPIVAIIGLSLAGNAIGDLTKVNYTEPVDMAAVQVAEIDTVGDDGTLSTMQVALNEDGTVNDGITISQAEDGTVSASTQPGSPYVAVICGLVTLAVVMLCSVYGKKMTRLIPFIIGILAGYAVATIFYFIGKGTGNTALMVIDYSALINNFKEIGFKSFISLPDFSFLRAFGAFGELNGAYFGTIAAAYIPVAFVVFAEHIADHKNLSSIIEHDLLEDPGLSRTLLGDGVGSMVGAFFGGCPNTTYGESIGCVAITKNASVNTIIVTAFEAIIISFITPFVAFLSTIPSCVMGGVCIALYGFIAVSGLKMLQKVDLDDNRNLFTASVILISGVGGFILTFGSITVTTVACALILGILTNVMLSKKKAK
ncbi:uracil-xanthine permease family protein [Ruminococcus sp.]|uniref:uracil-xanthine permease family protein n=1 Tax=Ruminococcus sp. TaxID=41978 RepID=UPI003890C2C9